MLSSSPSFVTANSPFAESRSRSVSPSDHLIKELPYIVKQEIGLFQSGEVSALRHPVILHNVIGRFGPAHGTGEHLSGESCKRHSNLHPGLRPLSFARQGL